jgi:hypothetical protein
MTRRFTPARLLAAALLAPLGAGALAACALDSATATGEEQALTALDCQCGADVTEQLFVLVDQLKASFAALSSDDRKSLCWSFYTDTHASMSSSWDIMAFYRAECRGSTQEGACGADACIGSVTVHNGCYFAGHVNYVLWGAGMSLCNAEMPADPRFGRAGADAAIVAYRCARHECQGIDGRLNWTEIGWLLAATGQLWVPYGDPIFGGETDAPSGGLCSAALSEGDELAWIFGPDPTLVGGGFGGYESYVEPCVLFETPTG